MKPKFCPACLRENRIATAAGPTCPHHEPSGANWFPANWATMHEAERIAWVKQKEAMP